MCRSEGLGSPEAETPWTLLVQALDALVADGFLRLERREGAELQAWSVVHGLASLTLNGLAAAPTRRERAAALESLLRFAVIGLCGEVRFVTDDGPTQTTGTSCACPRRGPRRARRAALSRRAVRRG